MIIFKTFLKILLKNKFIIITYTAILIFFGCFNTQTNDNTTNFSATKPDILIINKDENKGLTKDLITYLNKNSNIKKIPDKKYSLDDALFYRDVNYIIYIPKDFREDFLANKNPQIKIKSTKDYQASLAEMMLKRYLKTATIYHSEIPNEKDLLESINSTLKVSTQIQMTTKLNTNSLNKMISYYNFANYSILAGCVYVICLILSSFKEKSIRKRTIISSLKSSTYNLNLLLSNSLFALILWIFYVILSIILVGNAMFTPHGILLIINSFIFTLCALTLAFFIGTLLSNKNAINGIVNVIALGSSFLCGSFVPIEYLPKSVTQIAHILPSYYYIKNNELIKKIEIINLKTINEVLINGVILIIFILIFILLTNIITKKRRDFSYQ